MINGLSKVHFGNSQPLTGQVATTFTVKETGVPPVSEPPKPDGKKDPTKRVQKGSQLNLLV